MRQLRKPFQHTQALVIKEVREQIQEDMITFMDDCCEVHDKHGRFVLHPKDKATDALCQIVVDNFKRLED